MRYCNWLLEEKDRRMRLDQRIADSKRMELELELALELEAEMANRHRMKLEAVMADLEDQSPWKDEEPNCSPEAVADLLAGGGVNDARYVAKKAWRIVNDQNLLAARNAPTVLSFEIKFCKKGVITVSLMRKEFIVSKVVGLEGSSVGQWWLDLIGKTLDVFVLGSWQDYLFLCTKLHIDFDLYNGYLNLKITERMPELSEADKVVFLGYFNYCFDGISYERELLSSHGLCSLYGSIHQ
ncbi:hypothetical protein Dsin_022091 [Dipteronia sinensis]|uniref:Uncharacterized protein n=1 Tax=Dipteronia sinensis TaxID=43782 RepID=A0AAE0A267_9ROSI|nr:hypothetical protein Dsin_022091 [Dipteronia sinensis]